MSQDLSSLNSSWCDICVQIVQKLMTPQSNTDSTSAKRITNLGALLRKTTACPFCNLTWQAFLKSGFEYSTANHAPWALVSPFPLIKVSFHFTYVGSTTALPPHITVMIAPSPQRRGIEISHYETILLYGPQQASTRNLGCLQLPSPEQKISIMRFWLHRNREPPRGKNDSNVMPTRLVEIMNMDANSAHINVRLVESSAAEDRDYAALSHRWGEEQHLTLTRANFTQLHQGRNVSEFPATFRDAVIITARLGVRYLWIDAICIVQDSTDDWHTESQKMGDVFHNAFFVIAAHAANSDLHGFLESAMGNRSTMDLQFAADTMLKMSLGPSFQADVADSALSKRGWVLQERFLARKTMHFTPNFIYMEAQGKVVSETVAALQQESEDQTTDIQGSDPFDIPVMRELLSSDDRHHFLDTLEGREAFENELALGWVELVELYTSCELTKPEDKLFAISGIAQRLRGFTDNTYCAGVWMKGDMLQGLLWLRTGTDLRKSSMPRAPTPSWAAYDGPVQYPENVKANQITSVARFLSLKDASSLKDENFLQRPGLLTIEAPLIDTEPFTLDYVTDVGYDIEGWFSLLKLREQVKVGALDSPYRGFVAPDAASIETQWDETLVFLAIAQSTEETSEYFGLFLTPVDSQGGIYQRHGFGQLSKNYAFGYRGGMTQPEASWEPRTVTII